MKNGTSPIQVWIKMFEQKDWMQQKDYTISFCVFFLLYKFSEISCISKSV